MENHQQCRQQNGTDQSSTNDLADGQAENNLRMAMIASRTHLLQPGATPAHTAVYMELTALNHDPYEAVTDRSSFNPTKSRRRRNRYLCTSSNDFNTLVA